VLQLQNFLVETKDLKFIQSELYLPNGCRLDLYVQYPDDRCVGFDVTIGRSSPSNLRYQIVSKFHKEYENICEIVYIVTLSKIKHGHRTIRKCDQSSLKPQSIRVVHWSTIIDDPKYIRIFQQLEDEADL